MTPATNERPTRRLMVVQGRFGVEMYAVELRADLILIRPKGSRRGGKAEVAVPPAAIYHRALILRAEAERKERKQTRRKRA